MLEAAPDRTPQGDRAVCQSASGRHGHEAPQEQRAQVKPFGTTVEGTPLNVPTEPETTDPLHRDSTRRLTFDMSGGAKGAQRLLGRPLDGGVRPHDAPTQGTHQEANKPFE